jgi:hypothetical protein
MKNQLDEMLGSEAPVEEPVEEMDPFSHLIGKTVSDADADPFALMLDGMLAGEGLSKETETPQLKTEGYEEHEWELKSELVYEEDLVEAICKKCFRQMRIPRTSTWSEAMLEHNVNPNCGQGLAADVMDS